MDLKYALQEKDKNQTVKLAAEEIFHVGLYSFGREEPDEDIAVSAGAAANDDGLFDVAAHSFRPKAKNKPGPDPKEIYYVSAAELLPGTCRRAPSRLDIRKSNRNIGWNVPDLLAGD